MSTNPFSTRFIRPGALDYLFPPGVTAESLVQKLCEQNWQGQIIGPHGSGKSTLLAALAPALESAGKRVVQPKAGQASALSHVDLEALDGSAILVIDGFEQLSWLSRRKAKQICSGRKAGLLVTVHSDMGLPTLWRTEPNLELAQSVVARLLPPDDATITPDDVERAFAATGKNLRETLFALYDTYQQRRR